MTRQRVLLGLYLIGIFRTTLYATVTTKILRTVFNNNSISEGIYDMQTYFSLWFISFTISMSIILYRLSSIEPNENLTKFRDSIFLQELSIYSLVYILGHVTLAMITLLIYNISGDSSAINFYTDVITINGLVDGSFSLFFDNQVKYFLVWFTDGLSSAILPILILIMSNMIHLQSQKNDGEILFPVK
ncbi:MAG: hypothetical protein HeimC2_02240 [Candidatus Heimdallarchaeota archaeon LC_2]|nr:MAG: hypothetical protein HeimC2_02240 [Candidatus Heimdallarchaeota archaeon LC_2]